MTLRIGILGAARIAPAALLRPARVVPGAEVTAIAARDPARATAFARAHQIPRVLPSYAALVDDPAVDAVYNPLPNSLHHPWTLRALQSGKHVLCEKPLASNAREAEELARAADTAGRVLMEAFHYRYHPLTLRVLAILAAGELGPVRELEADFFIPLYHRPGDIRFQNALAGGATMDTGCYCISLLRTVAGSEPRVSRASAICRAPGVDRVMRAEFEFPGGITARMGCSLAAFPPIRITARVRGERGVLSVANPFTPHFVNWLTVTTARSRRRETLTREPSYNFQLRAFLAAIAGEDTNLTDGWQGVLNMRIIDEVYRRAGLAPRGES